MSETPLTDAKRLDYPTEDGIWEWAEQLERKLAEARAEIERLRVDLDMAREERDR